MARFDQRGAKGYGKGKNGYSSSGLSRAAHEEVSRTLVRILRYEASKYSLVISPEGWVSLDDLMQKCKGQIKNSPDEVLSVALDSEGSQGKRFEVDASKQWIKARYKHGPGQSGKGKGRGKGDKGDKGNENAGWENHQNQQTSYYDGAKNGGNYGYGENKNGGNSYGGNGSEYSRYNWQSQSGEDPWMKNGDPWGGWRRYEKKTSDDATATSADAGASGAGPAAPNPSPSKAPDSETKPSTETQQTQQAEASEATKDRDPKTGSSHGTNGTNGTNATHGTNGTWHRRIDMETSKTSKTPETSASSSPGVESFDISTPRNKGENWQKFIDPQSGKRWLHHTDTGEYFFEDRAGEHGWSQYDSDLGVWWHHDKTERWFFDPKVAQ